MFKCPHAEGLYRVGGLWMTGVVSVGTRRRNCYNLSTTKSHKYWSGNEPGHAWWKAGRPTREPWQDHFLLLNTVAICWAVTQDSWLKYPGLQPYGFKHFNQISAYCIFHSSLAKTLTRFYVQDYSKWLSGCITTCHTQCTSFSRCNPMWFLSMGLRQGSGLCSSTSCKYPGTEGTNQNRHWNHHRWKWYKQFGTNWIIVLMFVESQMVHIQSTCRVCNRNWECCSIE